MNYQDIKPISYIKSNAAAVLKYVKTTQNPVIVTQNGHAQAVILDIKKYQEISDALGLLTLINQGEKDDEKGKSHEHDKMFNQMEKQFFKS